MKVKGWFPLFVFVGCFAWAAAGAQPMDQRQIVLNAVQQRPSDPWPRGSGHVIMAWPGSPEMNKAYHEPGGSFSPSVGSFGVSFWFTDDDGNLKATSDDLPLDKVKEQWLWVNPRMPPSIQTDTDYYRALWSYAGPGLWLLQLSLKTNAAPKSVLAVRSVGPAGGPVESLDWNGQRLLINNRWMLTCEPRPASVQLGHEGPVGWTTATSTNRVWGGRDGWGFARFSLIGPTNRQFYIRDTAPLAPSTLTVADLRANLELALPDNRFAACLNAQVANLMMGLVGRQTRPGDPMSYPLNWLRDGAFIIVALAQAGQLEVARELAATFAETDFFGGFGPEADSPGLALWALGEVAFRARVPQYDRLLWPHVVRKANLIQQMRTTQWPIYKPVVGLVVPQYANNPELNLVCDPARNGLIMGRMDWQRPILYVNAVSYMGLRSAANIADQILDTVNSTTWRTEAAELKRAWARYFPTADAGNERTYTCGLWPSWIVSDRAAYLQNLGARWDQMRDSQGRFRDIPLWTYFDLAETHQWLCLGRVNQVWETLRWFWDNQSSPGLYTWWEGRGEENSFHYWDRVRGWVKPPNVTPHYWTAAEMLLLQLDMLARIDESTGVPILVIGAGIPPEWLDKPMLVRGLSTRIGYVDWAWNNGRMLVSIRGSRVVVRLGPSFPANTPVVIQ